MSIRQQVTYWGLAAIIVLLLLWRLGDVILPFVLGGAIAYLLDPVADRLERLGLSRIMAVVLITGLGLMLFVLLVLLVLPLLFQQSAQLVDTVPALFKTLQEELTARFPEIVDGDSMIRQQLLRIGEGLQARGGDLLNAVLSSAASVVNVIVLVVIVPVVAIYLLLDWDRMIARIDDLLPRDHAGTIRDLARDIDRTLASFIRGQGMVCLILGTFYSVALMTVGLSFGLVVGAIAGLITFIPYVGALVGGALALGLALYQFWGDWFWIGLIGGIFATGQFLEGNILTPRLVGSSVGLHPVWLLFALAAFGSMFGFVGLLVAVPVAAVIGVLTRFGIARYLEGPLYRGATAPMDSSPEPAPSLAGHDAARLAGPRPRPGPHDGA
ncbi:MAG: AI-2E family transporter [Rubellimicrobium sp.]|nr:AI-2E family transporter [Rubellimicrobium sp.]